MHIPDWPDFLLPPINLWNFPLQERDYMRNIKADARSASLKLNPKPRQTNPLCGVVIEPARGELHNYEVARAMHCKLYSARGRG